MTDTASNVAQIIKQIEKSPLATHGIELLYVVEIFAVSKRRLITDGHGGLLSQAAGRLIETHFPNKTAIQQIDRKVRRLIYTELAKELSQRPIVRSWVAKWIREYRNEIFADETLTLGNPVFAVVDKSDHAAFNAQDKEFIASQNADFHEEPIETIVRAMNYLDYIKRHEEHKLYFGLYASVSSLILVHGALEAAN